jgi:hypothetical protein
VTQANINFKNRARKTTSSNGNRAQAAMMIARGTTTKMNKSRKHHVHDTPHHHYAEFNEVVLASSENESEDNHPVEEDEDNGDEEASSLVGMITSSHSEYPHVIASSSGLSKSEMGVIEEIYCENFMCHQKMIISLGRNINFITGENGSGKSAIIAALQICLGASARTTHRGKSLKNLIRHGHDGNAIVRITLVNDGTTAPPTTTTTYMIVSMFNIYLYGILE